MIIYIHSAKDFSPHENVIIKPSKINYLVLGPFFPIFDAGGRHFFSFVKVLRNDAGSFFSYHVKIVTHKTIHG